MKELAIIGFGRFGRLAAKHLKKHFNVFVADKINKKPEADVLGVKFVDLKTAAQKPILILSVPVQQLEETLKEISKNIRSGTLVLDVCSVKVLPIQLMKSILPQNVDIIATHPLFGPQSAVNGIAGHKIVICPVKTTMLEQVTKFLQSLGLKTIIATPEEHDKVMARTQALSHFIGKALSDINKQEFSVPTFQKLVELKKMVANDSDELFSTIQTLNPFAAQARKQFLTSLKKIEGGLAC
ncbi:prephenate dehydrogenase [Candidatus Woesearchaeota archaeon]|nr:prephenate dehydrogenase [Candidatus Woesearchaeota archaeon]